MGGALFEGELADMVMLGLKGWAVRWRPSSVLALTLMVAGLVLVSGCMASTPSFDALSLRYDNAVADAAALGDATPQLRSEHLDLAQASVDAAGGEDVSPAERASLYALAVKSAWIGDGQRLTAQTGQWARDGAASCAAGEPALEATTGPACGVLGVVAVLSKGEVITDALGDLSRMSDRRWTQGALDQGAQLGEQFALEVVGAWQGVDGQLRRHGGAFPPGFAAWAREVQLTHWCAYRGVVGVEAVKGIAEGSREAFLARDRMREAYLSVRGDAERVLEAPQGGMTRMQSLGAVPGDEGHAELLCQLVRG